MDTTYKKNAAKVKRLINEFKGMLPEVRGNEQFWNMVDGKADELLPKYRDELPIMIANCKQILSTATDWKSCYHQVSKCIDYIGTAMDIRKFDVGVQIGAVQRVMITPYYQQHLPEFVEKVKAILNE